MRLIVNYTDIHEIPIIEIVPDYLDNKEAPLVVFYHGYSNTKDGMMTFGSEIAKKGFRVIMPDALHHGKRKEHGLDYNTNGLMFFEALQANTKEFPQIIQYYKDQDLIANNFIGVAGMSMGGMTSSLITTAYSNVNATVILMGSPQQEAFNQWMIDQYIQQAKISQPLSQALLEKIVEFTKFFESVDLGQHIEAIQSRPILFWHSKQDMVVPSRFTEEFIQRVKQCNKESNIKLYLDKTGGHKVPYKEMVRMAEFFYAAHTVAKEDIFTVTDANMAKRFA